METKEILVFLTGFLTCAVILYGLISFESSFITGNIVSAGESGFSDFLNESNIFVYDDYIVLKISGATISSYAPTGSMSPLINSKANGIRIVPENPESINVGDIISFERDERLIVHRIIEKGEDERGIYYVTRGDNSTFSDGKIRFEEIRYVTIGVLW